MLKRALCAAGAVIVAGVVSLSGAGTPASAANNVKPKVSVAPALRLRVKPPELRVAPRPPAADTENDTENGAETQTAPAAVRTAIPQPRINPARVPTDFSANAARLAELAEVGLLKENIAAMQDILNLSGIDGALQLPGLDGWGAAAADDGNGNIPGADGQNNNGSGNAGFGDSAGRPGAGAGPDRSGVAGDLLDSVNKDLNTGEKSRGGVAAVATPAEAIGGIASRPHVIGETYYGWESNGNGGRGRTTVTDYSDGSRDVTRETVYANGTWSTGTEHRDKHGQLVSRVYTPSATEANPEKGSGVVEEKPDPGEDIAKQQDPNADTGTVVWIPPNCGSTTCNGIRDLLKNPQGALRTVVGGGTKVHGGDDGTVVNAAPRLIIDQHGLVVSYGADSGPVTDSGGPVQSFDRSRIKSD